MLYSYKEIETLLWHGVELFVGTLSERETSDAFGRIETLRVRCNYSQGDTSEFISVWNEDTQEWDEQSELPVWFFLGERFSIPSDQKTVVM